jgi:hypothetical protein
MHAARGRRCELLSRHFTAYFSTDVDDVSTKGNVVRRHIPSHGHKVPVLPRYAHGGAAPHPLQNPCRILHLLEKAYLSGRKEPPRETRQ